MTDPASGLDNDGQADIGPLPETALALVESPLGLPDFPGRHEMEGMAAMAVTLSAAVAVPVSMRGKPNDVFLVLLTGRELGIPPTTAIRECHVIDGKVTVSPKLRVALARRAGHRVWPDPSNDTDQAIWHGVRRDDPSLTYSSKFTMEDARRVTIDKSGKVLADKDNWKNYPQRMLSWRAAGYLLDDAFSDVGTGLYSPDEMGSMTDEDGRVIDVATTPPLPGTSAPRGHTPPPPDPPASQEGIDSIVDRLEKVAEVPAARDVLLAMWTRKREDGTQTLPHPAKLLARQVKIATAMLDAIELRIKKGEFPVSAPSSRVEEPETAEPTKVTETPEYQEARKARAEQVAEEAGVSPAAPVAAPPALPGETGVLADQSVAEALREAVASLPPRKRARLAMTLGSEGIDLDHLTEAQADRVEALVDEATPAPFPPAEPAG